MAAVGRAIRFRVLGPLEVEGLDHRPRAAKQRLFLSALLATPGLPVTRVALAELVWAGAPPDDARGGLQVLAARLRRELAAVGTPIETTEDGYRIAVDPDEVDHRRFRALADRVDTDRHELEDALALWRGPPFGELGERPLLRTVARELELAYERLVARLHQVRLDDGEASALLPALARWAEDHPLDEAAWCRWAGALAATGRTVETLRVLHEFRDTLAAAGLEPSVAIAGLEDRVLTGGSVAGPNRIVAGRPVAPTEMLGRNVELVELSRLVGVHRLVSIVGVGGVGKTRLAVAMTHRELVLDNCEHVLDEVRGLVAVLLRACPNTRVLATSRQPLDLAGEIVLRLGPLAVLDADGRPGPATRLFVDRAGDRGRHLPSDEATMAAIIEICRRLDGLPLAVELAAARTTLLSPGEIADHLRRSFDILRLPHAPVGGLPRHQTLIAAIAWSYDLLEPVERELLDRLSVFTSSFDLAAIAHICGTESTEPGAMLHILQALVDRSLVVVIDSGAGHRYRLLDTIGRFAADRLAERGETERLRARHDQWYRARAAEGGAGARTRELVTWQRRFESDQANFRATFENLLDAGDVDGCQGLVANLWPSVVGDSSLVHTDWAPKAVAMSPNHVGPSTAAARAAAAWGAVTKGDYDTAEILSGLALDAVAAGCDDDGSAANVVAVQSMFTRRHRDHAALVAAREVQHARASGDLERLVRALAHRYFTRSSSENTQRRNDAIEAVERARTLGHPRHLGMVLCHLAWQHHRDGDEHAGPLAAEAATMSKLARDDVMHAYALHLLGTIAHEHGRYDEALDHVANALHCWRRSGDARTWVALHQIAELLADVGDVHTATMLGAGIGDRDLGAQVRLRPEALAGAAATIEPSQRERLLAEGARRTEDELIDLATNAIERRCLVR